MKDSDIMLTIPYTSRDFPTTYGPGVKDGIQFCHCSWDRIIHAAITVGKNQGHLLRFGSYSYFEIISRATLIYANLMQGSTDRIIRTDLNLSLDPTEKGAVSYTLGLLTSKLMCEKYLHAPWMMHLDVYKNILLPKFGDSKRKPDLVGRDRKNRWLVVESKGRSGTLPLDLLDDAKEQAENLLTLRGVKPDLHIASALHFDKFGLRYDWVDPEGKNENVPDLDISEDQFLLHYYELFINLFSEQRQINEIEISGDLYLTREIVEANLTVGIQSTLFQSLRSKDATKIRHLLTGPHFRQQDAKATTSSAVQQITRHIGSDGIMVQSGPAWSAEQMSMQPYDRS